MKFIEEIAIENSKTKKITELEVWEHEGRFFAVETEYLAEESTEIFDPYEGEVINLTEEKGIVIGSGKNEN